MNTYRLWTEIDIEADSPAKAIVQFLSSLEDDTCVNPVIDVAEWLMSDTPPEQDQATSIDIDGDLLPGGMSFVFDILNSKGSVVTTIVRETDNPLDALAEYAKNRATLPSTLTKMGWKAREVS